MNILLKTIAIVASLAFAPIAASASTVLDFEGFAADTILSNEYAGVAITGAFVLTAPGYNYIGFPPKSGSSIVYNYTGGVLDFSFTTAASAVGAFITGTQVVTLTAYNGLNVLGTAVSPGNNSNGNGTPNAFVSFTGPNITRVTFTDGSDGNTYTLDDFTYTAGSVPEAATWVMLVAGFGLTGATMRRRKAVAAS